MSEQYNKHLGPVAAGRGQRQTTETFFILLHENYRQEHEKEFYARRLNISAAYLSSILSKETGQTLRFWIWYAIIREAQRLLDETDWPITQIADEFNLKHSSTLSHHFVRTIGMTPTEYRYGQPPKCYDRKKGLFYQGLPKSRIHPLPAPMFWPE